MRLSPIVLSAATAWLTPTVSWASDHHHHDRHVSNRQIRDIRDDTNGDTAVVAAVAAYPVSYHNGNHANAELSTEFFLVPDGVADKNSDDLASVASVISIPTPNRTISIYRGGGNRGGNNAGAPTRGGYPGDDNARIHATGGGAVSVTTQQPILRQRTWALPLAALSAAAMLLMASFEVFVLLKARAAAPSRRHLFLGQALLLGLFLIAGLSAAASLTPNPLTCAAFRLVGLPAALVFAALLVKCVFLLSLNSGVYLPAPYQALVLVFAVLVQVAIVGQWFYGESPAVIQVRNTETNSTQSCCKTPVGQTVASLGYPGVLLFGVACLAIRARGVRDNYREAAFIGLAVGLSIPVWITSAIGSIAAAESDREAWLAYGLLSTSLLVFLSMFLPKGRQLAALGRDGQVAAACTAVIREREDRLSSLPASGYSPSFFHFKPADGTLKRKLHYQSAGCSACRHGGGSPVYSDAEVHTPIETFVLPPGMYLQRPELEAGNLYTTLSANPNVFFQRAHPGMMY